MAINQGTETIAVATQERTWRVNIETAKGADPVVTVYRETIRTAPDGSLISKEMAPPAARALSVIANEVQDFSPSQSGKITALELATLIAARADMWRAADIAAKP